MPENSRTIGRFTSLNRPASGPFARIAPGPQPSPAGRAPAALLILVLSALIPAALAPAAHALSQIQREELAPPSSDQLPSSPVPPQAIEPPAGHQEQAPSDDGEPQRPAGQDGSEILPIPEIIYDLERLPEPVRRMRERIIEACKSGDPEALRPLLGGDASTTQLSLVEVEGDPIAFVRSLSGDEHGQEILAILLEVLEAGFVHLDPGTDQEIYAWPYFFSVPLDSLDPRQRVELFQIVTAGDYEDMKTYGTYIFYRVGITPDGRWAFFLAGD